jgi:hypothetical protein
MQSKKNTPDEAMAMAVRIAQFPLGWFTCYANYAPILP